MIGPMLCEHEWMTLGTSPEAWEHRKCKVCQKYHWEIERDKDKQFVQDAGVGFEYA
jgi:hypothetical protein